MTKRDIVQLVKDDEWMMEILRIVRELHLPDWWIGAGFVRSKVWDYLHGFTERTPLPDIDVIYFNPHDFSESEMREESTERETHYEKVLCNKLEKIDWSVTNQARMHIFHNDFPYQNSEEALSRWVETATCVGVRLDANDSVVFTAPHGIEDLVNLTLRPTFTTLEGIETFHERILSKNWLKKWPKLTIVS